MIDRFERFSYFISEISRLWHRIAGEEMGKYGLKGAYSVYFTTLYRYPQGVTAGQLVELCSRDKADVSRTISLLESKSLVKRNSEPGKTYRAQITLTETGRQIAQQINLRAQAAVELASFGLAEDKRRIFYEALELITGNLQIISREGIPDHKE